MANLIKEQLVFLREFLTESKNTGTCFPTSKWAARELVSPLEGHKSAKNILELGPGTGSVTVKILEEMIEGDRLTICEINPRFMKALKELLDKNSHFRKHKSNITFFEGPIQEIETEEKFDIVVCALPFLNFEIPTIREIFDKLKQISKDDTIMTYYEYIGFRDIRRTFSSPRKKERIKEFEAFFQEVYSRHGMKRKEVWLNMLPIYIYRLEKLAA